MPQTNRWHPVMLPDDCLRKMKQDPSEVEAQVEAETHCEPVVDAPRRPTTNCLDFPAHQFLDRCAHES